MTDTNGNAERTALIDKVKALWAKAEDPAATAHEAEAFRAKAAEMMAKYEIDQFVLDQGNEAAGEAPIVYGQFQINDFSNFLVPDERMLLAGAIARNFECKGVIHNINHESADPATGRPIPPGLYFECIGYRHDFEMVQALYYSLVVDMLSGLFSEKVTNANYQREWAQGYVSRVDNRLSEFYRRVNDWVNSGEVSESVAVAVRSRLQKVQDKFDEMYPPGSLGNVKIKSTRYDENARRRGRARADAADIGGGFGKVGSGQGQGGALGQAKKEIGS